MPVTEAESRLPGGPSRAFLFLLRRTFDSSRIALGAFQNLFFFGGLFVSLPHAAASNVRSESHTQRARSGLLTHGAPGIDRRVRHASIVLSSVTKEINRTWRQQQQQLRGRGDLPTCVDGGNRTCDGLVDLYICKFMYEN